MVLVSPGHSYAAWCVTLVRASILQSATPQLIEVDSCQEKTVPQCFNCEVMSILFVYIEEALYKSPE